MKRRTILQLAASGAINVIPTLAEYMLTLK